MIGRNEDDLTKNGVPYAVGMADTGNCTRADYRRRDRHVETAVPQQDPTTSASMRSMTARRELIHIGQTVMAYQARSTTSWMRCSTIRPLAECYRVAALMGLISSPDPGPRGHES